MRRTHTRTCMLTLCVYSQQERNTTEIQQKYLSDLFFLIIPNSSSSAICYGSPPLASKKKKKKTSQKERKKERKTKRREECNICNLIVLGLQRLDETSHQRTASRDCAQRPCQKSRPLMRTACGRGGCVESKQRAAATSALV